MMTVMSNICTTWFMKKYNTTELEYFGAREFNEQGACIACGRPRSDPHPHPILAQVLLGVAPKQKRIILTQE